MKGGGARVGRDGLWIEFSKNRRSRLSDYGSSGRKARRSRLSDYGSTSELSRTNGRTASPYPSDFLRTISEPINI